MPHDELLSNSMIKLSQLRIWDLFRAALASNHIPLRFDVLDTAVLQRGKRYDDLLLPFPSLPTRAPYLDSISVSLLDCPLCFTVLLPLTSPVNHS